MHFASNPKFLTNNKKAYTEVLSGEIKVERLIRYLFISGYIVTDSLPSYLEHRLVLSIVLILV